jgi:hypothetical protein
MFCGVVRHQTNRVAKTRPNSKSYTDPAIQMMNRHMFSSTLISAGHAEKFYLEKVFRKYGTIYFTLEAACRLA